MCVLVASIKQRPIGGDEHSVFQLEMKSHLKSNPAQENNSAARIQLLPPLHCRRLKGNSENGISYIPLLLLGLICHPSKARNQYRFTTG